MRLGGHGKIVVAVVGMVVDVIARLVLGMAVDVGIYVVCSLSAENDKKKPVLMFCCFIFLCSTFRLW